MAKQQELLEASLKRQAQSQRRLDQAQELLEKLRSWLSHDISTPLAAIRGALSLMSLPTADEENSELLHIARASTDNLLDMVAQHVGACAEGNQDQARTLPADSISSIMLEENFSHAGRRNC